MARVPFVVGLVAVGLAGWMAARRRNDARGARDPRLPDRSSDTNLTAGLRQPEADRSAR